MTNSMPVGICQCGCGRATNPAARTAGGNTAGEPTRFLRGHSRRNKGLGIKARYATRQIGGVTKPEHVWIVEKVLGKALPPKAEVHHVNGDGFDNAPGNLVVCEDQAYHMLLHRRQRALRACGHPSWRRCYFCKTYSDVSDLSMPPNGKNVYHIACSRGRYGLRKIGAQTAVAAVKAVAGLV